MKKSGVLVVVLVLAAFVAGYYAGLANRSARQQRNIAVVTRFLNEVVSGGRIDILGELWARDLYWYNNGNEVRGLDAFEKQLRAVVGRSLADMKLTIDDIVASDDKVVVRFKNSARNAGPFLGLPPTNRTASWDGIGIYRLKDGKIVEAWFAENDLAMLSQFGLVKLPGEAR